MQYKEIDNRGLSCPQPVINTKKALQELLQGQHENFLLTVIVDNESAKENVIRMVKTLGCLVTSEDRKGDTYLFVRKPSEKGTDTPPQENQLKTAEFCSCAGEPDEGLVLLITSATLGQGSEELGTLLMRSFIYSLRETASLPDKILFLNGGVFLTVEGSPVLEDLHHLVEMGVEVFSCGTCLDYYQLKDKLQVGNVTNMYDTVESICFATRCVTL